MAKNTDELVDKTAETTADVPPETIAEDQPKTIRALTYLEINGVKIPGGRVASLNNDLAQALIAKGAADDSQAAIDYALSENPWIIDPFNNN